MLMSSRVTGLVSCFDVAVRDGIEVEVDRLVGRTFVGEPSEVVSGSGQCSGYRCSSNINLHVSRSVRLENSCSLKS
jgi:hypothetical protein